MISGERLLGRLLGRADEPVALADTPALRVHAGIQLRLDQHGHVLELHGLAMAMGSGPPRLLIDYLVPGSTLALEGAPRDWQGQSLDLMFQVGGGPVVYTRGWVQPHGDDWLLQLLDISDVLMGQQQARSRALTHLLTTHMGEQLRHCGHGRLPAVVTDLLQQVAHHWHIPCVALALPDTTQAEWRIYSVYRQHDAPALWEVDQALGSTLDSFNGHAPQRFEALYGLNDKHRLSGLFGNTDGLLVPYNDHQGVSAWLLFGQYPASRHASAMGDMDWLQVCAALAGPLLSRLRELQHVQQMERMEALQGLLGSGWWEWSASTRQLLLAPPLAASLLPGQPAHVPREAWLGLFHPADREELASRFNDLLSHDKALLLCVRLHQPDSTRPVIWYRIQGQVLGGEGGPRVVGFMLDVSDMQNQQQQAAAAHARLDNLIASSPAVIYVQRYAEGALLPEFFSASLQPLLGWTREECTAATLIEWVHPDDRAQYFERTRRLLREGNVRSRYRLRDREGDYHWLLDEARLLRDDLGLPVEAVGLWLDITDATEAAERVKHSEERYRMLVEDSPAMICRYTPDLTLTFGNRPLGNYLECAPEQLPGINLSGWLSPEQQLAFVQRLATLTPEFPVSTAEISLQLPGREHAWWVWSDRGVFDEHGVLVEVQAVGRDNTEVRRSQQQLTQSAKMATLGEMATGLAHEINQPLNVMRMAIVNVLKRLSNGDVQIDYLQEKLNRLDTQVQRAARVVDHMRVFGRRSEIEQQVFNPAIAIDGTLSLLSDGLRGKGVEIRCEGLDCAVRVRGHVDQLEQVLINLLVNARDALLGQREKDPDFAPWIALGIETDPGHVRLWVHDNAGGIDPRLLERIFEPFFTTKPVGVGTGLGLSVSYGIIENMGGRLSVSNTEHGARFCIALPVVGDQSTS
ncbi:PAS domain-containing sensor histidine kinase [Pseudomonas lundensis]|uniref:PAS domain-containing sensor histidine kinase n=1 Tax=Pseudomonas lundensis TaxID=86185 RepID=UPI0014761FBF|nr:PAS domain-containing sensor histidine kinase [Pseudomonas lundensis]NMZ99981.1 PAS domain-containing protein [Pseudomonas lundensis]